MPQQSYDYIIVGAGSAGCTLAYRLSEDPGVRVLLLEAGGWDRDPWITIPLAWARMLERRQHDWGYFAEPEATMGGRGLECARGKVIGGSSSINAMAYVRGNRGDYDRWAGMGLPQWSYAHVLPYFRRQESWEGGTGPYRGGDGPLTTVWSRYQDPLVEAYEAAGQAAGHPATDDYNGAEQEGFARWQATIRDGRRCSAAVAAPLPGVGRNLQDHISAGIVWQRSAPGPLHAKMRLDRIARELSRNYFFGTGITNNLPGGVMAFLKSEEATGLPDIQLLFAAAPMMAKPYLPPFTRPYQDSFGCRAAVLRPESRGRLELASADPRQAPRIRQNFLATDKDWKSLRAGLRLIRDIARQGPLRPFIAREMAPGPAAQSDDALDAHIRATAITVHHPLGTCRMGGAADDMAVVDGACRVIGVAGLRVVDASVMPDLVGGNINAPVIMIAEKAADMIRGRDPLAPVNV